MTKITKQTISLNKSLNLIEKVVLYNVGLYESVEDKIAFIEKYYIDLVEQVFQNKNYIIETLKFRCYNNLIVESKVDLKNKIREINESIRRAVEFESLMEQYKPKSGEQNYTKLPPVPGKEYKGAQISQGPITPDQGYVHNRKSQKPRDLLAEMGLDSYFETLRSLLHSAGGVTGQVILSLTGPGKIAINTVWGIFAVYDYYKYRIKGQSQYLIKLIQDIFAIILNLFLPKFSKMREFIKATSQMTGTVLDGVIKLIAKILGKKIFIAIVGVLASAWDTLANPIIEGLKWIESELGINLGSGIVQGINEFFNDVEEACRKSLSEDKSTTPEKTSQTASLTQNKMFDTGKI